MTLIVSLILLGLFLGVVEILLLPGITIAGIGAVAAYTYAIIRSFNDYGNKGGIITTVVILVLSIVVIAICLRAKTWRRVTLNNSIDSKSLERPEESGVKIGDRGIALTRLAPMGKVSINNQTYEAKSIDVYVDQKSEVEVVDFENTNIIIKLIK